MRVLRHTCAAQGGDSRIVIGCGMALAILLAGQIRAAIAQDTLDTLRSDVRTASSRSSSTPSEPSASPSPSSSSNSGKSNFSNQQDDSDNILGSMLGALLLAAVITPFEAPRALACDSYKVGGYFAQYPYDGDLVGSMVIDSYQYEPKRSQTLRLRAEHGTDFSGNEREGIQFLFDTGFRLGVDADTNYRHQMAGSRRDHVWTGDSNLVFRFAQCETWQMRAGLGANWMADGIGSDVGFNFTYGGDFFPAKPWVISAEIDAGTLGHAGLFHFRTSIGAVLQRYEVYTGYDYYDVGRFQSQGLIAGLRFWF